MPYQHLTRDQRVELAALRRAGLGQAEVARQLGKHPSTVCRELARNAITKRSGYDARIATTKTQGRRLAANQHFRKIIPDTRLSRYYELSLRRGISPEQISGRLKFVLGETVVAHETIYQWAYQMRPDLRQYLPRGGSKYRHKRGTKERELLREEGKKRRIDTRPAVVEERSRIGDWEGDTIIGTGHSGYLATVTERLSGYELATKLERATGEAMLSAVTGSLAAIPPEKRLTLTLDNGTEMSEYEAIEAETGAVVYFAYPYHSWERGTNENTNGLLRRYFPKKMRFDQLTQAEVDHAVWLLNTRPRKRLGYMSPHTVFHTRVALRSRI